MRMLAGVMAVIVCATPAHAHGHKRHHHERSHHHARAERAETVEFFNPFQDFVATAEPDEPRHHRGDGGSYWARPARWCGWWMRRQFGGGPEYNMARLWARRGSAVSPQAGAVVVWPHHVGLITGRSASGQWIVKSGNDGGQVRERPRSLHGAIAFRQL